MRYFLFPLALLGFFSSCEKKQPPIGEATQTTKLTDDELFTLVQKQTFQYFWDGAEPTSGLARERYHVDGIYPDNDKHIVTSGGSGFGVMAILVGVERGFITRQEGFEHLKKSVDWLEKADRFHGVWPHWLNGETGKTKPFSTYDDGADLVETSYLMQGLLCVRQYFKDGNEEEKALAAKIDQLWRDVQWDWHQGPKKEDILYWHWSPQYEWKMNFGITGWNECLITYVLAACSPTHGVSADVYHKGWAQDGAMVGGPTKYGKTLAIKHNGCPEYGGPLFWSHYSFLGLDPRKLKDRYADYWEHNRNHVLIDYDYCVENPKKHPGYGKDCWGLTASYSLNGYAAHRPEEDLGVISPTAALSSFPYTPEQSQAAMRHFYDKLGDRLWGEFGFCDAFSEKQDWFPRRYLAIDQGPMVVMMENHRSGLLWRLFMSCPEVKEGLGKLGFSYQ
ncbi:MAG: beta-glucosidase [Bacteroidetes bacterium]|nr:beta-glucosidase [Bacteroidota bacterium]